MRRLALGQYRLVHLQLSAALCHLMRKTHSLGLNWTIIALLLVGALMVAACGRSQTGSSQKSEDATRLTGTWVLTSRILEGRDVPATTRLMKLTFNSNGTFRALYRGDETQKWIAAGSGGYSYARPLLTLFWDSGPVVTILVEETESDRFLFHHGRNLVPHQNQEPDEIFVRQKVEKGPTRQPS